MEMAVSIVTTKPQPPSVRDDIQPSHCLLGAPARSAETPAAPLVRAGIGKSGAAPRSDLLLRPSDNSRCRFASNARACEGDGDWGEGARPEVKWDMLPFAHKNVDPTLVTPVASVGMVFVRQEPQ